MDFDKINAQKATIAKRESAEKRAAWLREMGESFADLSLIIFIGVVVLFVLFLFIADQDRRDQLNRLRHPTEPPRVTSVQERLCASAKYWSACNSYRENLLPNARTIDDHVRQYLLTAPRERTQR